MELPSLLPPAVDDPSLVSSYVAHRGGPKGGAGVLSLGFRPFMKHLVSAGADGSVLLWGLVSCHESRRQNRRPYRFKGHKGPVCAVAVSPLDTVVASGSKDRTIRIWLPRVDATASVIKAHSGSVRTLSFSPDGDFLLSGSDDKTVKVWDVETEKFVYALVGHLNWVRFAEFNRDGRVIVSGSDDKTIRLWDVETRECVYQYADILGMVRTVRFHPEGTCIASGGSDECIQIWDTRSKALVQHYAADAGVVNSVSFHPSGNFLLSTCDDGALRVWDLREGQLLYMLKGHSGSTTCAEFSKDGEFFASGGSDEQVMVWRSNFSGAPGLSPGALRAALKSKCDATSVPASGRRPCAQELEQTSDAIVLSSSKHEESKSRKTEQRAPVKDYATRRHSDPGRGIDKTSGKGLEKTLQNVVIQLDRLVTTVASFDERLSRTETTVKRFIEE